MFGASGGPNPALSAIQTQLTNPAQAPPSPSAFNNTTAAGGLAGVASTFKGPSIKIYKDRQKYQEWEFIFDLKSGLPGQPATPQGPSGAAGPPGQGGQPGQPGQPTTQTAAPAGPTGNPNPQ